MYYDHIQTWLRAFPVKRLHVLRMEDYSTDPVTSIKDIFSFLNVSALSQNDLEKLVTRRKKIIHDNTVVYHKRGPMLESTRKILESFYHPFNERMAAFMKDKKYLYEN